MGDIHENFSNLNLNFKSQNVRSLNISTLSLSTQEKIFAITKSNEDIIFLCDTRLNEDIQHSANNDVRKKLQMLGYDLVTNSKTSLRGVCILLKRSLSYTLIDSYRDHDNNIILLKLCTVLVQ